MIASMSMPEQRDEEDMEDIKKMPRIAQDKIHAKGIDIGIFTRDFENEYISLTDIAKYRSDAPDDVIKNWMRNRDVIEFLG